MEVGRNDLETRLFNFTINTIKFLGFQAPSSELNIIKCQLPKSTTSSGTNYEEAQAVSSKLDFTNKARISLREMRESNYWLRILKGKNEEANLELEKLIKKSKELKLIIRSNSSKGKN